MVVSPSNPTAETDQANTMETKLARRLFFLSYRHFASFHLVSIFAILASSYCDMIDKGSSPENLLSLQPIIKLRIT